MLMENPSNTLEWKVSQGLTDYRKALEAMENRVEAIIRGDAPELVWLLEHPPLYTAGTSSKASDLLDRQRFPVFDAGRGGQFTYHGPGQRVAYVLLDLKKRAAPQEPDLRAYVKQLEQWIIATLAQFGVDGFIREGRVGVWVDTSGEVSRPSEPSAREAARHVSGSSRDSGCTSSESKIAAIGVRVKKWVTFHGISLNVRPDLSHYAGIVPCGISEFGVTSLEKLGVNTPMDDVDAALKKEFAKIFKK